MSEEIIDTSSKEKKRNNKRKEDEDEKEEDENEEIEEEENKIIKNKKKESKKKKAKKKENEKTEELDEKKVKRKYKKKTDKKNIKKSEEIKKAKINKMNEIDIEEKEEIIEDNENNDNKIEKNKKEKRKKILHINENFEKYIMEAYQKINILYNENEEIPLSQIHFNLKPAEKMLRSALKICEEEEDLKINLKIIDRLNRLSTYNEMNLNYIIGNIYISLMNKENLFDDENENDLLLFVNKVIQFREIMKNTKLGIKYNISLNNFLSRVTEDFDLDETQLNGIKTILENNKEIAHNISLKNTFSDFIFSLAQELEMQPNIYEQYRVFIQNKNDIIDLIELCDLDDKKNYNYYLKLGKYLAYLFHNKTFSIYLKKDNNSDSNEIDGIRQLFFDGYSNKGEMDIVNDEKYIISDDDIINDLREKLCEIILAYAEKFIDMVDFFSFQYLIYVLLKRIYFSHYENYNKQTIITLLAESLLNMCFFKESPLGLIKGFINKILKSEKNEHLELKNVLIENLKEVRKEPNFLYKLPKSIKLDINEEEEEKKDEEEEEEEEEEESEDDFEENEIDKGFTRQKEEVIFIFQNDIKLGFFNYKVINAGEKFVYYEEINKEYSVLDFCLNIDELDIKVTITDLTEGREIFSKDRVNCVFDIPLKIIMFFTTPRILKFEFDNSYSWLRSKTIEYKTNIFYPKHPYLIGHQILISKYQKIILQSKNKEKRNKKKGFVDEGSKILITKINEEKKVFNFVNVNQNLNVIDKMVKDKYLSVSSIFIKIKNEKDENNKSYFYYYKENEGLIENELTKENMEKYLYIILSKSKENLYVFNLYIINGDSNENNVNHYYYYSIKKLLGFEPVIKIEGVMQKIIFFIQNLSQSQLLYYLYKHIYNNESIDIILLINYSKYGGYNLVVYNNEEISSNLNELFSGLNKNTLIDENIKIICKGIEKLVENDDNIDIILTDSIDDKENEITPDKLEEKLIQKGINKNRNNIRIIKTNAEFNKEIEKYSHVFYLDN